MIFIDNCQIGAVVLQGKFDFEKNGQHLTTPLSRTNLRKCFQYEHVMECNISNEARNDSLERVGSRSTHALPGQTINVEMVKLRLWKCIRLHFGR